MKVLFAPLSSSGHLNTAIPLALALQDRGHHVFVLVHVDVEKRIVDVGLEPVFFANTHYPKGSLKEVWAKLGKLTGKAQLKYTMKLVQDACRNVLEELPDVVDKLAPDLVILDECNRGVHSVCEAKKIPTVTLSSALTLLPDPAIPPVFSHRGPSKTVFDRWLNAFQNLCVALFLDAGAVGIINEYREKWHLHKIRSPSEEGTPTLHLTQEPKEFAFPRSRPVGNFHYLGPLCDVRRESSVPFPWAKLDGRKLVYASMGTIQNQRINVFQTIAAACEGLDVQLVISLGGGISDPKALGHLAGDPIVVSYAPQLELLRKANVCITHAGMNTTIECLANGVPMVALPAGNDQPGVAAHMQHCGAGISLRTPSPKPADLRNALKRVLNEAGFRENAQRMAKCVDPAKAREKACDLIEEVMKTVSAK